MQRKQMNLALLLCALVCMLTLAVGAVGTKAADGWYELSSADDIANLAAAIASGKTGVRDQKYRLTCDIDMSKLSDGKVQQPIGLRKSMANWFIGEFDGCGYTVSNVDITSTSETAVGFFGVIGGGAVRNLTVQGKIKGPSITSGDACVGGIVGKIVNAPTIENCTNQCELSGGSGTNYYIGGILGHSYGSDPVIRSCANEGTVIGGDGNLNCTGGIVGYVNSQATIEGCVNTGKVTSGSNTYNYAGGIVGYAYQAESAIDKNASEKIIGCVNKGTVSGPHHVGGIVGYTKAYGTIYIERCANLAPVSVSGSNVGGITSVCWGATIRDCLNAADIGSTETGSNVGGIAGCAFCYDGYANTNTIENCFSSGTLTGGAASTNAILGTSLSTAAKPSEANNYYINGDDTNTADGSYTGFDFTKTWMPTEDGPVLRGVHVHTWDAGSVTTAADVGVRGVMTYTCTTCADEGVTTTKTASIPALRARLTDAGITGAGNAALATLRLKVDVALADGENVTEYGVIFVPTLYRDGDTWEQTYGAAAKAEESIAGGERFAADLEDIPAAAWDMQIAAWAYVKLADGTVIATYVDCTTVNTVKGA